MWDSGDFIATYIADPDNGFSELFNSEGGRQSYSRIDGIDAFVQ